MTIGYVDTFSGASGDMLVGALLDAGLLLEELQESLARLGLTDYRLLAEHQVRRGISGVKFVVVDEGAGRPARNLAAVSEVIGRAGLEPTVAAQSQRVFQAIAEAEAKVHGTTLDEIHFHEIGAVDSLIDIVGFCWGLHRLGIEALFCSPLPLGNGTVATEHGLLPVPAPATLELLAAVGAPTVPSEAHGELLTPTGAALLAACATFARPAMTIERVGYGFGTKEFPWANMLRLWVGQALPTSWVPGAPQAGSQHPPALDQSRAQAHQDPHQHQHEGEHHHSAAQDVHEHDHEHGHAAPETHDHPHEPCAH